jgi:hypothetical protein
VSVWVKGIRCFLIGLGAWNGLFFMERVVRGLGLGLGLGLG